MVNNRNSNNAQHWRCQIFTNDDKSPGVDLKRGARQFGASQRGLQDAACGIRRRRRIMASPPNPRTLSIPGSGVERVLVLKANVAASVEALELLRKSLAVSLAVLVKLGARPLKLPLAISSGAPYAACVVPPSLPGVNKEDADRF
jgi:hypothetical protein